MAGTSPPASSQHLGALLSKPAYAFRRTIAWRVSVLQQVGHVDPMTVIPSKVIAISNPIKIQSKSSVVVASYCKAPLPQVWQPAPRGRRIAGNRRQMPIRSVDAAGGVSQGFGTGGGLCLGEWQTVLWYQGRSRVVPDWYQCAPGSQPAILTIANTYAARSFAVSCS